MKKIIYLLLLALLLSACGGQTDEPAVSATVPATLPATDAPTEPVTEAPTEPQLTVYTLSFVGDCTLGCTDDVRANPNSFDSVVGEDYDYPLANLEGTLTDTGKAMEKQYAFRGTPAYAAILSGSSVEAVSNSNNHYYDYGETGMRNTRTALDDAGIARAWRGSFLYTTGSGLTIGVYCDDFSFEKKDMEQSFADLRARGAEVIVCAFHWGGEKVYKPNYDQQTWGRIAIDAGADIVAGHHPHVLQPIEYYGDGVIFYSLGNFCYGGNMNPKDKDTAIVQQQFIRCDDGSLAWGETVVIPCSVSSVHERNNYQPTPLAEGTTAYERVLQKLDGTFVP